MNRRDFITGLLAAPVIIRTPGLLMPVKAVAAESWDHVTIGYQQQGLIPPRFADELVELLRRSAAVLTYKADGTMLRMPQGIVAEWPR